MRPLLEILNTINLAVDKYRVCKLSQTAEQSEILRDLVISFKDLSDHKIESGKEWLDAYNKAEGTNAHKERVADREVLDYDLISQNMRAISNLIDGVRSTISANKV